MSKYIGNELELFKFATNWKRYFCQYLIPHLGNNVAEIGAGIGGTTEVFFKRHVLRAKWLCVEPDSELILQIENKIKIGKLPHNCSVFNGFSRELTGRFDTIIYIDVLEHIFNVNEELNTASDLLDKGGKLLIIVPAFQFLFSPFDSEVGHFRRYTKKMLKEQIPKNFQIETLKYLDSVGFFTSCLNKLILKQKNPTLKQVKFWDTFLIPLSKIFDVLIFNRFGKSLLLIASKA